ncbi:hypothetical protein NKG05_05635 [Oerskovia sp. M15]
MGHGCARSRTRGCSPTSSRAGHLEVCPASNVSLGVYDDGAQVPLGALVDAGAQVALGADDPLLFGSRLVAQYESARTDHGFSDEDLADLARSSIRASRAGRRPGPACSRGRRLAGDRHRGRGACARVVGPDRG